MFSKMDMIAGYWQIKLAASEQMQTVFSCKTGSLQFKIVQSDLMNDPAAFGKMVTNLFKN